MTGSRILWQVPPSPEVARFECRRDAERVPHRQSPDRFADIVVGVGLWTTFHGP